MNTFVEKLQRIERRLSIERGPFELFAALRPDSSLRLWDLLVTAPWLRDWSLTEMRIIASQLNAEFPLPEILKFSRIAIIEGDNPGLRDIHSTVQVDTACGNFETSRSLRYRFCTRTSSPRATPVPHGTLRSAPPELYIHV